MYPFRLCLLAGRIYALDGSVEFGLLTALHSTGKATTVAHSRKPS